MSDIPNIILVVFDTLRLDALGCYGGKVKTPVIDSFAADSVKFEGAVAPSSWTAPTHASLFSGKYPSDHGIHVSVDLKIDKIPSIANRYTEPRLVCCYTNS